MKKEKPRIILATERRLRSLTKMDRAWDSAITHRIELLFWLADYFAEFSPARVYLNEIKSDLLGVLFSATSGLERTVYLHGRGILENLVRFAYYDSRPVMLLADTEDLEGGERTWWSDLIPKVEHLPHFKGVRSTSTAEDSTVRPMVFGTFKELYAEASGFIHASTSECRSLHESINTIGVSSLRSDALSRFVKKLYDASYMFLALYGVGPYILISQPIRGRMLDKMSSVRVRESFLAVLADMSLGWVLHQREAALRVRRDMKRGSVAMREGILLHKDGTVSLVSP